MSKQYTTKDIQKTFLWHVKDLVRFWENVADKNTEEKLDGLAFSILACLDGCSVDCPGFIVAPHVHPDDKEYHQERGEDWYPDNKDAKVEADIAGSLHELYCNIKDR